MTTWKRWSWRYRMGALVALTMLLQGASCFRDMIPSFTVPGVQGAVTAQILHSPDGVPFYEVLARDDGKGTKYYRYVYPGDPEYDAIINFFRTHPDITVYDFSRPSIPGGAGTLPAPAVQ